MTVDTFQEIEVETGAASHPIEDWSEIDWQKVQEEVRRLQAHIVKATQGSTVMKPRPAKGVRKA